MGHARALLGTPDRAFQEQLAKRIVDEDLSVRAVEEAIREHETGRSRRRRGTPTGTAPRRPPALRPPGLLELEELLGDHLDTRVKISMGAPAGKVVVEFSTLEDLERIYRLMTDGAGDAPACERDSCVRKDPGGSGAVRSVAADAALDALHDGPSDVGPRVTTSARMASTSTWATGSQITAAIRVSRSTAYVRPQTPPSVPRNGSSCSRIATATRYPASDRNRPDSK